MMGLEWVPWAITVVVALIGVVSAVVVRKVAPAITVQDLWDENRRMRERLDLLEQRQEADHALMNSYETRAEALVRWLQKIARVWPGNDFPMPDEADMQILDLTIPRVTSKRTRKASGTEPEK